jgi:hypothetical protein
MALTPLTALERETTIIMNDEDTFITIYSCQRPIITKLDKLCKSNPDTYRLVKSDEYSKTYECPKKLLSEEQKEELRIRMQNVRKKS